MPGCDQLPCARLTATGSLDGCGCRERLSGAFGGSFRSVPELDGTDQAVVSGLLQALVPVGTSQVIRHGLQAIQNENEPFGIDYAA